MTVILKLVGAAGLCLTAIPAALVALGKMDVEQNKTLMMVGMVLWFGAALTVHRVGGKKSS